VILGAAYLLWLYQRTMLGQVTNPKNLGLPDLNFRECAVFAPLVVWAIWIGVYPKPYFDLLRQPVTEIVERVKPGYFAQAAAVGGTDDRFLSSVTARGRADARLDRLTIGPQVANLPHKTGTSVGTSAGVAGRSACSTLPCGGAR
jgi:hypothetical protein